MSPRSSKRGTIRRIRPGTAVPLVRAAVLSLKFFGIVILGNLLALVLLLVPGVNLVAFFVVNGYLLGREFFEFAAMRFRVGGRGEGASPPPFGNGADGRVRDRRVAGDPRRSTWRRRCSLRR